MSKRRWRACEVGQMLNRFTSQGAAAMVQDLSRSVDAITGEAQRLGLSSPSRRQRQAISRARNNASVNIQFFETLTPTVAYCLGFIWAVGTVKKMPRHVLSLRCPANREVELLVIRDLLKSRHHVQRRRGQVVCEVSSYMLVKSLLHHFGCPPSTCNARPRLPSLPAMHLPHFCRGLLAAAGFQAPNQMTLRVRKSLVKDLLQTIRDTAGVRSPRVTQTATTCKLIWSQAEDLKQLNEWLGAGLYFPPETGQAPPLLNQLAAPTD